MLEELKEIDNIYDLMALCGMVVLRLDKEQPYDFSAFRDGLYEDLYDAVEEYCFAKEDRGSGEAFAELKKYIIGFLKNDVSIERCFAVMKCIDELVAVEYPCCLLESQRVISYPCMNKRFCEEIRIIPKNRRNFFIKKEAEMKERNRSEYDFLRKERECKCTVLDGEIINYIIWDKENIEKYPFTVYYLSEKHFITKHFIETEKLTFAIIPFIDEKLEDVFEVYLENKIFEISKMKPAMEQKLKERYQEIYQKCKEKNIDFLIFPEMLMTECIVNSAEKSKDFGSPWLVINGSMWEERVNRTWFMDSRGEKILSYCKKEPFIYKETFKEHLDRTKNQEYAILEIENFGRIGIAICKDLVNENIKMFHKYIGTNLLFVPAYTESMDLQSAAGELSRDYKCIVIVANACSAIKKSNKHDKKERIGFISLPAKNNSDRTEGIITYYQDGCRKGCCDYCGGKLISIIFDRESAFEFGTSYMIEKSSF